MITPEIMLSIVLALSGWNLLETVALGKKVARMEQRLKDLPCDECR